MEPLLTTHASQLFLLAAAFFAGLIDAVVGGGGLIQIPAIFSAMPNLTPATVFGTNKLAGIFGTAFATVRFTRRVATPWAIALPAALTAFGCSYLGALCVTWLPKEIVRPLVLALLIAVTLYTYFRKGMGAVDEERPIHHHTIALALFFGGLLGFYDGFFGPGTGSFLIFVFIHFFGLDFLRASLASKIVNTATNLAALLSFGFSGHILYETGLAMAAFNVGGSWIGSHLALRHGTGFIRKAFLIVSGILILKFAHDIFWH